MFVPETTPNALHFYICHSAFQRLRNNRDSKVFSVFVAGKSQQETRNLQFVIPMSNVLSLDLSLTLSRNSGTLENCRHSNVQEMCSLLGLLRLRQHERKLSFLCRKRGSQKLLQVSHYLKYHNINTRYNLEILSISCMKINCLLWK